MKKGQSLSKSFFEDKVLHARNAYLKFINKCNQGNGRFGLTSQSEETPFALCFAIFGYWLLWQQGDLDRKRERYSHMLKKNLATYRKQRRFVPDLGLDKPYLQLLAFTMSALSVLGTLRDNPLENEVAPLLSRNLDRDLRICGALEGKAQSGNMAMFKAILLIHGRDYLGIDTQKKLDRWVELHMKAMNRYGFWGGCNGMTHLQFQNGYHQYEILDFLGVDNPKREIAAENVEALADHEFHFAPYPGGNGCYDYDAVSIMTSAWGKIDYDKRQLLIGLAASIIEQQNEDGGFGESRVIRPRSTKNIKIQLKHIVSIRGKAQKERLRIILALMSPKHDKVKNHWSRCSRSWDESDLWNSWFRMLTIARIQVTLFPRVMNDWCFINYPGIGFHSLLKKEEVERGK